MKEEKEFCSLCGKYTDKKLQKIPLGEVSPGIVASVPSCPTCFKIHSNLQFAFREAQREYLRREKEKALQLIREKGGVQGDALTKSSINK